jgi:hypothetical protein
MIAESIGDGSGAGPLTAAVREAWNPDGSGGALLLNTTDANYGYQIVVAPFSVRSTRRQDQKAFMLAQDFMNNVEPAAETNADSVAGTCAEPSIAAIADSALGAKPRGPEWTEDLRISSAVAMSAGFPVAIGGGSLKKRDTKEKVRLVDGGYYENSGVETLLQIVDQLREHEKQFEISIHVIVLDTHYLSNLEAVSFEPLKAVLSARSVRSQIAVTNLYTNRSLTNDLLVERCTESPGRSPTCGQKGQRCQPNLDERTQKILMCPSEECKRLENKDNPGFGDRFGRLRPFQLSLDLERFKVPLAFALSYNANRVIDSYSGDSVCDKSKAGRTRRKVQVPEKTSEEEREAVRRMDDRLQCSIDSLCNSFSLLQPLPSELPAPTAVAKTRQPCPMP